MLDRRIGRGTARVAVNAGHAGLLGGLLFSAKPPAYHVRWLVTSKPQAMLWLRVNRADGDLAAYWD